MTSVLYSSGLNYQSGNPLRTEIRGLRASITELETLVREQSNQIAILKSQTAALEKSVSRLSTATASAVASASTASTASVSTAAGSVTVVAPS